MSALSDSINELVIEKKIPVEKVQEMISGALKATYKRKYMTDENAEVVFAEDLSSVTLFSNKEVVADDVYESGINSDMGTRARTEGLYISLSEAQRLSEEAEIGDILQVEIDPTSFKRTDIQTGKQNAQGFVREYQKNELLQEYSGKVGELITGYVQSDRDGDLLIDIGKTQGFLPKKNQSPIEVYQKGDKIICYVESVRPDDKNDKAIRVLLSRAHENFVRKLFSVYVPELDSKDPSIEIMKIVREPGFRTKVAVAPKKSEVDAVGTCVGLKGQRIQSIMNEMNNERIDVVKWDANPLEYIANALSPAKVSSVYVLDSKLKKAVAVVDDSQLSLAIGKQGLNVRLVTRLCDWVVDVKTQEQFAEMDMFQEARANADAMFMTSEEQEEPVVQETEQEDEFLLTDLPIDSAITEKLKVYDIWTVEEFINLTDEDLSQMNTLTAEEIAKVNEVISENVDIVEDESGEDESLVCPNCGTLVTVDMTECPNCHVGLSFSEEVQGE